MADMMDTLKGLLGDNADEKLSGIMSILNPDNSKSDPPQSANISNPSSQSVPQDASGMGITPEMLHAAQALLSRVSQSGDDDRTRLLMSLKPYMRKTRQDSIEQAVKMLNMAQMSQLFKEVM